MLQDQATSSLHSSSERSSSSSPQMEVKEGKSHLLLPDLTSVKWGVNGSDLGMESDEEISRVPDFGFEAAGPSTSGREATSMAGPDRALSAAQPVQRRRGRSPADKEHTRLKRFGASRLAAFDVSFFHKRLLRNRVSAQQARERKKAYLHDLEAKAKDLDAKNTELEERLSTLQKENNMLRQVRSYSLLLILTVINVDTPSLYEDLKS
ncbi:hypothetical protein BHE74_00018525 [Ensete ventricosum]|nr:hypothetical protein BHE74_00018525 [Ensete ventricosum]